MATQTTITDWPPEVKEYILDIMDKAQKQSEAPRFFVSRGHSPSFHESGGLGSTSSNVLNSYGRRGLTRKSERGERNEKFLVPWN